MRTPWLELGNNRFRKNKNRQTGEKLYFFKGIYQNTGIKAFFIYQSKHINNSTKPCMEMVVSKGTSDVI